MSFKTFILTIILLLTALYGFASAATVRGYARLECATDHSDMRIIFCKEFIPHTCDTFYTSSTGYYYASGLLPGYYDITIEPPCLGWYSQFFDHIYIIGDVDWRDNPDTLEIGIEGELDGEFCRCATCPFPVNGDIWISDNDEVKIPADSLECDFVFHFMQDYTFKIEGELHAVGDANDSITFTTDPAVAYWGGLSFENADNACSLYYCVIEKAKAESGDSPNDGGGVYIYNSSSIFIKNCSIRNNFAYDNGGGIYVNNSGNTYIESCKLLNNKANDNGGGIGFNSQTNYARVSYCDFIADTAGTDGGGIYSNSSYPYVLYSTFENNRADDDGGGIYCSGLNQDISNCDFLQNSANDVGGGVCCQYAALNFDLISCEFHNNSSHYAGAFYYAYADSNEQEIRDCIIKNNSANNVGGVYLYNSDDIAVISCTIDSNTSSTAIGGIYINNCDDVTFEDGCVISNNIGGTGAGGLRIYGSENTTLDNCIIVNNSGSNGGGIYSENSSPDITFTSISDNTADSLGGGLYLKSSSPIFSDTSIISNNTAQNGGGIYFDSCDEVTSPTMFRTVVHHNNASDTGSGIYSTESEFTMENCTISNNDSSFGCALYGYSTNLKHIDAINTIFYHNECDSPIVIEGALDYSPFYCDVEGGWPGTGNIDCDPEFVDHENGNYHLTESSCVIDSGWPGSPTDPDVSIADIGAYWFDTDSCLWCNVINHTPRVPRENGEIQWDMTVGNCGNITFSQVVAEILPTNIDCNGPQFDFEMWRVIANNLTPGDSNIGYYYFRPATGTVPYPAFIEVALWTYVGSAWNNYIASCCFEFTFTTDWGRGGNADNWGADGEWGERDNRDIQENLPTVTSLSQNYPNPFNATTIIKYALPAATNVSLDVYNLLGQKIETIVEGYQEAGHKSVQWDASMYSSGVYFYKLSVGEKIFTKRMLLLK